MARSRLCRLIRATRTTEWKSDGVIVDGLLQVRRWRLPKDPEMLGRILFGLGEIDVRCTCHARTILLSHVKSYLRRQDVARDVFYGLQSAAQETARSKAGASLNVWDALLEYKTLKWASAALEHPWELKINRPYGVKFAAPMLVESNATGLETALIDADRLVASDIVSGLIEALALRSRQDLASILLRMRKPIFPCLGAARLLGAGERDDPPKDAKVAFDTLCAGGVDPSDAFWMCATLVTDCMYRRNRVRHRPVSVRRAAPRNGAQALDGAVEQAPDDFSHHQYRLVESENILERQIDRLAACWPSRGLSDQQMIDLDAALEGWPELRYRLAVKLEHDKSRSHLLDLNLRDFRDWLGAQDEAYQAFGKEFSVLPDDLGERLPWAAKSHVARHADGNIGKKASHLVGTLANAALALLAEPYIAPRQPTHYSSAAKRAAISCLFSFYVVAETPAGRRDSVSKLGVLAVTASGELLVSLRGTAGFDEIIDHLICVAVWWMRSHDAGKTSLKAWQEDAMLPPFAQAMAAWAALENSDSDGRAIELFRLVAQRPLSRRALPAQVNRLGCLLDLAIDVAWKVKAEKTLRKLAELWSKIFQEWTDVLSPAWKRKPEELWGALEAEGPARDAVLKCRSLQNGYVVGTLNSARDAD